MKTAPSRFRLKLRVALLCSLGLAASSRILAQSCANNEFEAKLIVYKSEHLPIELSGFFPFLPTGPGATGEAVAVKYTTLTWAGGGAWINPACGCFTSAINAEWSGAWEFSVTDFSSTDSRRVDYLRNSGCGGGEYIPFTGTFIPGPTSVSETVETSNYPGPPTYSSCINGNIYYDTNATATLTRNFTLEMAKTRAENFKTIGAASLQFWNNNYPATAAQAANLMADGTISRITPITAHAQRVKFSAEFCEPCIGKGKFLITYYYKKWLLGQPEPAEFITQTEEKEFTDPPYLIEERDYHYELKQGEQCKLVKVTAKSTEECKRGQPGDGNGHNQSVDMSFSLGSLPNGSTAGVLEVSATAVSSMLYSPATLQLRAVDNPYTVVVRQLGVLRQVNAPQVFADIVTLTPESYEIRFYQPSQVGAPDADGVYAVSGTPYVAYLVENPDTGASNRIRFTESRGSAQKVTLYDYDAASGVMEMTSGNGARIDRLQKVVEDSFTTETRTIKNSLGQPVTVTREIKYDFAFGPNVVQTVLDPAGAALTTNYTYYADPVADGRAYGHVKLMVEPSGRWTHYTYDSLGRNAETVTQFLNTAVDSAANLNRQTVVTYTTVPDIDGDSTAEQLTTTVESLLGQEIGRSFQLVYSKPQTFNGQSVEVRASIRAVAAGAAWDAAGNLVTLTRTILGGPLAFKPMSALSPDQTLTVYQYDQSASSLTTTMWQGEANAAKDAVISGTKTITIEDLFGHLVSSSVSDVATNLVLRAQTVSTTDTFGRPTRIDYADGTFETRSYACCGLESTTDRTGITTTYTYDDLGHVTQTARAGLTMINTLDPDGRVLVTSRKGTDNSVMIQQTNTYDPAGRQLTSKDALDRTTTFTEVFDGSGNLVRTVTAPDGGTRITTSAKDGSAISMTGTATQQLSYAYGVDVDGPFTQEIRLGSSGETTEWTKAYRDFAGREYKTAYADGAVQRNFYNALDQLEKSIDPDGVATLFAYNARGEQTVTALDVDRNDVIDYTGIDRVTRTLTEVAMRGAVTVQRTTMQVWETDGQDAPTTLSISEQSVDGLLSWQTLRGLTSTSAITLDGFGGRTVTGAGPDGVKNIQVFSNERLQSATVKTAANAQLAAITYVYDAHGRLQSTTDARTGATSFTYYGDDQIHTVTSPDPDTSRSGDGYDPQTTTYAYDSAGRQNQVTQANGGVVNTAYWPTGAVKRSWGSRTYPVEYTYDAQGRMKTLTTWQNFAADTGKSVTTWNYNAQRGWLDNKRYADSTGPGYTYKPSGRLFTRTWARGVSTTYGYNNAGDVSGLTYSDTTTNVTFGYDRLGRPKTRTDAAGVCNWTYHASGQLQDELYVSGLLIGQSVERDFDSLQRLSELTGVSIPATTYGYDDASRLQTVTQGIKVATYGYLTNSPLVETIAVTHGGVPRLTTTKTYDKLNRLTSLSNALSSQPSALSYAYTYNSADQRTRATRETNIYWDYGYDALGQVASATKKLENGNPLLGFNSSYGYDDIGNRKTATANSQQSTYAANGLNQYTQRSVPAGIDVFGTAANDAIVTVNGQPTQRQGEAWYTNLSTDTSASTWSDLKINGLRVGGAPGGSDATTGNTRHVWIPKSPETFTYDPDGNLTGDGRWSYTWDAENRLSSCETRANVLPPVGRFPLAERRRLDFAYDGQGRRVSKRVSNWNGATWVVASNTSFLYDGWNMLAELNALNGNAAGKTYAWGLDLSGGRQGASGVGGLLFANLGSTSHAVAYDGNGNVSGVVDMAGGGKSATYDYDAFGETILSDGPASAVNPFRFSSKYTDDETSLLYYGLRYYNTSTGHWLSRDPLAERGGSNLYGILDNNPVGKVDPLGLDELGVTTTTAPIVEPGPQPGIPGTDDGAPLEFPQEFPDLQIPKVNGNPLGPKILTGVGLYLAFAPSLGAGEDAMLEIWRQRLWQRDQILKVYPVEKRRDLNSMRVQLQTNGARPVQLWPGQEQRGGGAAFWTPDRGVQTWQIYELSFRMQQDVINGKTRLPKYLYDEFNAAVGKFDSKVSKFPPGGVIQGGEVRSARVEFGRPGCSYRIDLQNLRGHNLRY
jgi:RHS repeat-associated protein